MGKTNLAPEPSSDASIDELERDIERTREELGQTVEELAGRAAATVKPVGYAVVGLAAATVIVCVIAWRRRR
ncbi:DUF3618 domain-containing protein [Phytoactinopolyspora mesophila]|uniref:DUF3618 domain-containing protein n=1 Tax=Phytoactinopolyspora mesophila TaxID=2650750 RepID=A0A7K3M460_9ACTN|nr:DUF3618 domain-containing protein [Phytoactinopolyspora mesophila]NDL58010.1 DUF3618 domain-containing protein [Phytoactinopolyspora mesophila]